MFRWSYQKLYCGKTKTKPAIIRTRGKGAMKGHKLCTAESQNPQGIPLPPGTALSDCPETGPPLAPSGCCISQKFLEVCQRLQYLSAGLRFSKQAANCCQIFPELPYKFSILKCQKVQDINCFLLA